MSNNQQLLVILEPDNHPREVVARAGWVAGPGGYDITLLWCSTDTSLLGIPFLISNEARDIGEAILAAQARVVNDLAKPLRDKGFSVNTEVLQERPVMDGIVHHVEKLKPAYLLKGTQYHAVADRSIFVDRDWQLMRDCHCPLWLVKPTKIRPRPVIVAAVDPVHSHDQSATLDQVIINFAQRIATLTEGEMHLLHTYQWLTDVGTAATRTFKPVKIPVDDIEERIRKEHQERLDALAAANHIDAEHTHQLPGNARELVPAFVREKKADLVVMGALARWGLKRAIIGSTAERVLDKLHCDILIVRSDS